MSLSTTLSSKSICYKSTSVPSLARLQRLLEAGNSARYLQTSWGRACVRNPSQKIALSEELFRLNLWLRLDLNQWLFSWQARMHASSELSLNIYFTRTYAPLNYSLWQKYTLHKYVRPLPGEAAEAARGWKLSSLSPDFLRSCQKPLPENCAFGRL